MGQNRGSPEPAGYKWIVLAITTIGVLMVSIDTTVIVLAFPQMMVELGSDLIEMVWVLLAYIFASTVFLLALGRVADIYGRVRLYNLGFALFTVGSALCGLAPSAGILIASRIFQGIGGALMLVNAWAILTEVFPPSQRGMAMGINSMTFGLGSIAGPLLGGAILAIADWRWVFLINVPIGAVGTLVSYRRLRPMPRTSAGERLDLPGVALFTVGLFALLLALTQGISLGWLSGPILGLFATSLLALAGFVAWERRVAFPALDLRLFRSREFDLAVVAAGVQSLAVFAVQFLIVFYFQAVLGDQPLSAAVLLLPMPLMLVLSGPFAGRLSDRIGARLPATAGLLIQGVGILLLSAIAMGSPYSLVAIGLALVGLGGGMFYAPNTSAAMGAAAQAARGSRLGVAAATLATVRNVGMVTGFALTLAIAAASLPRDLMLQLYVGTPAVLGPELREAFVLGMQTAFHGSAVACFAAAAISSVRSPGPRRR